MLDAAFGWIGQVASWLGQWFPRWLIVPPYEAGVKFPRGKRTVPFGPGVTWYWPATTKYLSCVTSRVVLTLGAQKLTTVDGVTVEVGGMLAYRVVDPVKFLVDSYNAEHVIDDAARAGIRRIVVRRSFAQLHASPKSVDAALKKATAEAVEKDFGVEILYVRLADFVKTRSLSVSGVDFPTPS